MDIVPSIQVLCCIGRILKEFHEFNSSDFFRYLALKSCVYLPKTVAFLGISKSFS